MTPLQIHSDNNETITLMQIGEERCARVEQCVYLISADLYFVWKFRLNECCCSFNKVGKMQVTGVQAGLLNSPHHEGVGGKSLRSHPLRRFWLADQAHAQFQTVRAHRRP